MQPKRLIISVLVVILMLVAAVLSVSAAPSQFELSVEMNSPTAIITDGPVIIEPGDIVDISINIDKNPGVNMFSTYFDYDPELLEPVLDENGKLVHSWGEAVEGAHTLSCIPATDRYGNEIDGKIYCFIYDKTASKDNKKTGEVVTIQFKVKELFHGTIKVSVSSDDAITMGDSSGSSVTTSVEKAPEIHIHTKDNEPTYTQADCENDGTVSFKCSGCNQVVTEITERAKGHNKVNDPAVPSTCTTTGLTAGQHCSVCNKVLKEQVETPLADHKLGPDATCTEPQKCTVCNQDINPAAHKWVEDAAVEATCTTAGKTAGKHCSVCNVVETAQTDIPAKGHTPGAAATCTTAQICTVCNAEIVPAGHTPGAEATCTTAQTCTVCNAEIAPAKGHTPGAEATCAAAQTCTVCNEVITPAKAHTVVAIGEAEEPTMFKEGKTAGEKCSVCGEILKAQETIAKKSSLWLWIVIAGVLVAAGGAVAAFFFIKKKKTEKKD